MGNSWQNLIQWKGGVKLNKDIHWEILKRKRSRWQLLNGRTSADPSVIPAAVCWIDAEIEEMKKAANRQLMG